MSMQESIIGWLVDCAYNKHGQELGGLRVCAMHVESKFEQSSQMNLTCSGTSVTSSMTTSEGGAASKFEGP
jgi:hypothetical protein